MKRVFKPELSHWFSRVKAGLVVALATIIFAYYTNRYGACFLLVMLAPDIGRSLWTIQKFRRWQLILDDKRFEGRFGNTKFDVQWSDVTAASFNEMSQELWLFLATMRGGLCVTLRSFDASEIWRQVQLQVSPESLKTDAYKQQPSYKEEMRHQEKLVTAMRPAVVVKDALFLKIFGWACVVVFGAAASTSWWIAENLWLSLMCFVLTASGIYLLLENGQLEIDTKSIARTTRLSRQEIGWHEVKRIVNVKQGARLIFSNETKRMVILGMIYWSDRNKAEALKFINAQVIQRRIEVVDSASTTFKLSKHTKST